MVWFVSFVEIYGVECDVVDTVGMEFFYCGFAGSFVEWSMQLVGS